MPLTLIASPRLNLQHQSMHFHTHNSTRHTNHNYIIHCIHNQLGQWVFVKVHNDKTTSYVQEFWGKDREGRGQNFVLFWGRSMAHVQCLNPKNCINMTYSSYIKVVDISNIISSIQKTNSMGESCLFMVGKFMIQTRFFTLLFTIPKKHFNLSRSNIAIIQQINLWKHEQWIPKTIETS
jgi:hypothetical protein